MISNLSHPLFAINRGPCPEIVVHGASTIRIQGKTPISTGSFSFLSRSLLNPWQYLAADVGGKEEFWSIGLSFHSGQDIHMYALEALSKLARSGEEELFCPREYPLDWEHAARLKLSNRRPLRVHHPCSGKHLVLLAACEQNGYEKDGYWDPSHPLQKKLFSLVGKEAREAIQWAYDSCGLPSFVMNDLVHTQMWENLVLDESEKVVAMKELWVNNPRLVGGKGRLDSDLTIAAKGQALVKEGADGLLMVQSFPSEGEPAATCLIKLASGYHKSYLGMALYSIIKAHPVLPSVFHELKEYLQSRLNDWLYRGQTLAEPPF